MNFSKAGNYKSTVFFLFLWILMVPIAVVVSLVSIGSASWLMGMIGFPSLAICCGFCSYKVLVALRAGDLQKAKKFSRIPLFHPLTYFPFFILWQAATGALLFYIVFDIVPLL